MTVREYIQLPHSLICKGKQGSMTPDKVYHGSRYDIPADTWAALLETIRELKGATCNEQKK